LEGLAYLSIKQKKTLLITDPQSYAEYDDRIDLIFDTSKKTPMICIPIMDREA
jgi:hypothetical protein